MVPLRDVSKRQRDNFVVINGDESFLVVTGALRKNSLIINVQSILKCLFLNDLTATKCWDL